MSKKKLDSEKGIIFVIVSSEFKNNGKISISTMTFNEWRCGVLSHFDTIWVKGVEQAGNIQLERYEKLDKENLKKSVDKFFNLEFQYFFAAMKKDDGGIFILILLPTWRISAREYLVNYAC
ncbi:MAG: hypothetical protein V1655_03370 [bacterium]